MVGRFFLLIANGPTAEGSNDRQNSDRSQGSALPRAPDPPLIRADNQCRRGVGRGVLSFTHRRCQAGIDRCEFSTFIRCPVPPNPASSEECRRHASPHATKAKRNHPSNDLNARSLVTDRSDHSSTSRGGGMPASHDKDHESETTQAPRAAVLRTISWSYHRNEAGIQVHQRRRRCIYPTTLSIITCTSSCSAAPPSHLARPLLPANPLLGRRQRPPVCRRLTEEA
jgi:hypothetical protein